VTKILGGDSHCPSFIDKEQEFLMLSTYIILDNTDAGG
jgi:hypothetical protein